MRSPRAIGQRTNQGPLKKLAGSLRLLKKALDDHQRASRLRDKAASVGPAQAAIPLHAVVHGLIEHFQDSVGSGLHEAKAGINACYLQPKADLNKLLAPTQFMRCAEQQLRHALKTTDACFVDLKEPPVRRKVTKLIDANFDPTVRGQMLLPSKGEWVDKAGCPSPRRGG